MIAGGQPYGVLKKTELARTLMSDPKLIIMDEPAAGLNETETDEMAGVIKTIRDKFNCTILLIEHDMKFVMGLCERICAISFGKYLNLGTPQEIQSCKIVQGAYLGENEDCRDDQPLPSASDDPPQNNETAGGDGA
jgi:branched-chain amino acid transport system ATP-binding protein